MSAAQNDSLAQYVAGGVIAGVLAVAGTVMIGQAATSGDQSTHTEAREVTWSGIETVSQTRRDLEATYPQGPERDWWCRVTVLSGPSILREKAVDLSDFFEARDGVEFVDSTTVEGAMTHYCIGVEQVETP